MRFDTNISTLTVFVRTVLTKAQALRIIPDNLANAHSVSAEPKIGKRYLFRNYAQGLMSIIILLTRNQSAVGENGRKPEGLLAYEIAALKSDAVLVVIRLEFQLIGYKVSMGLIG